MANTSTRRWRVKTSRRVGGRNDFWESDQIFLEAAHGTEKAKNKVSHKTFRVLTHARTHTRRRRKNVWFFFFCFQQIISTLLYAAIRFFFGARVRYTLSTFIRRAVLLFSRPCAPKRVCIHCMYIYVTRRRAHREPLSSPLPLLSDPSAACSPRS